MHAKLTNILKASSIVLHLFAITLVLNSCKITKTVPDSAHLLVKNKININKSAVDLAELQSIIKQKPNRKFFGVIRFNLRVYNFGSIGKERKWKNWFKNTIGEAPVLIDSSLTNRSAKQIQLYLYKKGYFNAQVEVNTELKKNKTGKIIYKIETGTPYTIADFVYKLPANEIGYFIMQDSINCIIKKGRNYDEDKLEEERVRINNYLRNIGYYYFVKEYLTYSIDSTLGDKKMRIFLSVNEPHGSIKDSLSEHKRYKINNVFIYPYFFAKQKNINYKDTLNFNDYTFIYNYKLNYKPKTLTRPIFIQKNDFFAQRYVDESYRRLNLLKNFKQITIYFDDVSTPTENLLNANIKITPAPKQSISFSAEGTNSSGNLGVSGSANYQNKNLFRGAEILDFKLKGGIEVQQIVVVADSSKDQRINDYLPFNTLEFGPELSLNIPRFLFFPNAKLSKRADPKTTLSVAYNYQARPDYYRTIANFSFGYSWRETQTKQHIFYPLEINFVKVNLSDAFKDYINTQIKDILVRQSYSDLMISSNKYSFIFNNQDIKKKKKIYQYFRFNFEQSGLLLYLYSKNLSDKEKQPTNSFGDSAYFVFDNEKLAFLNQPFAQFARTDFDYRIYKPLKGFRKIVVRATAGVGYSYGNSNYLPFIKSFFGGGSNDIRAWRARTLGPGSFPAADVGSFEQIGDIKLQSNLEYRYKIYKSLHGATFIDAGNIWLLREDSLRAGGNFEWKRFYKEIAMGGGFGLRYDFSFFIFRLDIAVPFYDPSYSIQNRWIVRRLGFKDVRGQIGIGYPF